MSDPSVQQLLAAILGEIQGLKRNQAALEAKVLSPRALQETILELTILSLRNPGGILDVWQPWSLTFSRCSLNFTASSLPWSRLD